MAASLAQLPETLVTHTLFLDLMASYLLLTQSKWIFDTNLGQDHDWLLLIAFLWILSAQTLTPSKPPLGLNQLSCLARWLPFESEPPNVNYSCCVPHSATPLNNWDTDVSWAQLPGFRKTSLHCCKKGLFPPLKSAQIKHLRREIFYWPDLWKKKLKQWWSTTSLTFSSFCCFSLPSMKLPSSITNVDDRLLWLFIILLKTRFRSFSPGNIFGYMHPVNMHHCIMDTCSMGLI